MMPLTAVHIVPLVLVLFVVYLLWVVWQECNRAVAALAKLRANISESQRWLAEFPDVAMTLGALRLDDTDELALNLVKLRDALRARRRREYQD